MPEAAEERLRVTQRVGGVTCWKAGVPSAGGSPSPPLRHMFCHKLRRAPAPDLAPCLLGSPRRPPTAALRTSTCSTEPDTEPKWTKSQNKQVIRAFKTVTSLQVLYVLACPEVIGRRVSISVHVPRWEHGISACCYIFWSDWTKTCNGDKLPAARRPSL